MDNQNRGTGREIQIKRLENSSSSHTGGRCVHGSMNMGPWMPCFWEEPHMSGCRFEQSLWRWSGLGGATPCQSCKGSLDTGSQRSDLCSMDAYLLQISTENFNDNPTNHKNLIFTKTIVELEKRIRGKSACCSCRRLEFSSQHPCQTAHDHL